MPVITAFACHFVQHQMDLSRPDECAGNQDDAHRWPRVLPSAAERLLLHSSCELPVGGDP